jgi:GT2 family glycosyltransferase
MNQSEISISIVSYNSADDLSTCLGALKKQSFTNFKLYLIDNGSTDNSVSLASKLYPEISVIHGHGNIGFGAGHNLAIAQSKTDWHLILNADVALEPNALMTLIEQTSQDDVAAIGGILYFDEEKQLVDSTGIELTSFIYHARERKVIPEANDYPFGISGACALLRVKALKDIAYNRLDRDIPEYFDETLFLYKEDLDMSARFNRHGWKSFFVKQPIGVHTRTGATEKKRKQIPDYVKSNSYKNHILVMLKNAPLYFFPTILIYEFAKFSYLLLFEPKTLKVIPSIISLIPKMLKRRYV